MKAYTTRGDGIDALELQDRPLPVAGPGEVVVRMRAASLNFRDLLVIGGAEGWKPRVPRVPFSDGVGEIVALGEGVTRWTPGERVAGLFLPEWIDGELTEEKYVKALGGPAADGVLAEYVTFPEPSVVAVPAHLSDEQAATLPVAALTAWHAVARRSRVHAGDHVLIQGTGGVSIFATQFVAALDGRPIVLSSSDAKLERARQLGAVATINYRQSPAWEREVLELTDGRGVDHVIEVVGGENLNRSLRAVKVSGTISFIGLIAGLAARIDTYRFVTRNVQIHGIETGSREMFEEMNAFIEARGLEPVVHEVFAFGQVRECLRRLEGASHFGKLVVRYGVGTELSPLAGQ